MTSKLGRIRTHTHARARTHHPPPPPPHTHTHTDTHLHTRARTHARTCTCLYELDCPFAKHCLSLSRENFSCTSDTYTSLQMLSLCYSRLQTLAMTRYKSITSLVCSVVTLAVIVTLAVAHQQGSCHFHKPISIIIYNSVFKLL